MRLSIVTTMYQSARYLAEFYGRCVRAASQLTDDFEIIFVNDGSPDNSLEVALGLFEQDDRIRIVDLSRNFGHHKAMMTGLAQARGEIVFSLDCDLEQAPEVLGEFWRKLLETKAEMIYGIQIMRQDPWASRLAAALFYKTFNLLSSVPVPENMTMTRLMTRRFVRALLEHRERECIIGGLCALTGFRQVGIPVEKKSKGVSSYNLRRKVAQAVNAITSFSDNPLVIVFYLGCLISFVALAGAGWLIASWLLGHDYLAGWPSVIVSIWLLGGLMLSSLGIIGIYLSKIYIETKGRPFTIIRTNYEVPTRESSDIQAVQPLRPTQPQTEQI
jgi:putative glycosyltransferase